MNPLISVIVPIYNRSIFIEDCLNSVINQSYRPIELILVDDGSTDNSNEILNTFKKQNESDNFRIEIITQSNCGAPSARNNGFKKSTGKYIQFLDSDDILLSNKLQTQFYYIKKHNCEMVYSKAQHISENKEILNFFWGDKLNNTSNDYFNFSWQTMCPLYKRETINKIGLWNVKLNINQDWEYCIRTILSGVKIGFHDEVLAYFRVHSKGNIGSGLDLSKIKGKELATTTVYQQLIDKNLLDKNLLKKYFKRYTFILISYSSQNHKNKFDKLFSYMKKEFGVKILPFYIFRISFLSNTFLKFYLKSN